MKKMTRVEMEQRLKELERSEFYIHMADFWDAEDKRILKEIEQEMKEIKEALGK